MVINFHYILPSPPCRAVMILAKQLGLELNLINVDLLANEHKSPEFLKLNPRLVVPVIDDNGFVLAESRAILTYLVNCYSPGHSLYPADAQERAIIDRILYLTAELWEKFRAVGRPVIREGKWPVAEEPKKNYLELLKALELLTAGNKFLAGDDMTIADISYICDLTVIKDVLMVDITNTAPGIAKWAERMKSALPEYDQLIAVPIAGFRKMLQDRYNIKLE